MSNKLNNEETFKLIEIWGKDGIQAQIIVQKKLAQLRKNR